MSFLTFKHFPRFGEVQKKVIEMYYFDSSLKPTLYLKNGELAESEPDKKGIETGHFGHFLKPTVIIGEAPQIQTNYHFLSQTTTNSTLKMSDNR